MNRLPVSLEGRSAQLVIVAAMVATGFGLGILFRHGSAGFQTIVAAKVWFPYTSLSARWLDSFWDIPVILVFAQFPAYAAALIIGGLRGRLQPTAFIVTIVHIVAAILSVSLS